MPIGHIAFACLLQAIVGVSTGDWWAGTAAGGAFYFGREQARAEYRWIERYGLGLRANMPWFGWMEPKVWDLKSVADFVVPLIVVVCVAIVVTKSL